MTRCSVIEVIKPSNPLIMDLLRKDEGLRLRPFYCTNRYPTIGFGFKIGAREAPLPDFKISKNVAECWLADNVVELENQVRTLVVPGLQLSMPREAALISMAYQMGVMGLLGFVNTLKAVHEGDYLSAAIHMLDSDWYREDTPARAVRTADIMRFDRV